LRGPARLLALGPTYYRSHLFPVICLFDNLCILYKGRARSMLTFIYVFIHFFIQSKINNPIYLFVYLFIQRECKINNTHSHQVDVGRMVKGKHRKAIVNHKESIRKVVGEQYKEDSPPGGGWKDSARKAKESMGKALGNHKESKRKVVGGQHKEDIPPDGG